MRPIRSISVLVPTRQGLEFLDGVLAALADPVAGQNFRIDPVCPHCQADATHFRKPKWASKTPRVGEVDDASFRAFLELPENERGARVVAVVNEVA